MKWNTIQCLADRGFHCSLCHLLWQMSTLLQKILKKLRITVYAWCLNTSIQIHIYLFVQLAGGRDYNSSFGMWSKHYIITNISNLKHHTFLYLKILQECSCISNRGDSSTSTQVESKKNCLKCLVSMAYLGLLSWKLWELWEPRRLSIVDVMIELQK